MKKIQGLFQRNYETDRLIRDEVVPGSEWVVAGEGVATRKYDGTCCLIKDGMLYKRHDVKAGKTVPEGFIPAQEPDPETGHWPGWVAVGNGPEDARHMIAYTPGMPDGTYELVGPKVQSNPEGFKFNTLILHGCTELPDCPTGFEELKEYFIGYPDMEGVVWHHPDGRMVKIKMKDFGLKRLERTL